MRHHLKDEEETTTGNNKNRSEEDVDGHIFYPFIPGNLLFLLIQWVPPGCKLGVWVGGLNHKLAVEVQALSGALSLHSVSNHMSISSVVALCFNFSSPSTTISSSSHLSLSPICSTWRQLIIYVFIYIGLKIGGAAQTHHRFLGSFSRCLNFKDMSKYCHASTFSAMSALSVNM